jgi:membrane-bound lytic murein transglycosylase B
MTRPTDIERRAAEVVRSPLESVSFWGALLSGIKARLLLPFAKMRLEQAQHARDETWQGAMLQSSLRQEAWLEQIAAQGVQVIERPVQSPVKSVNLQNLQPPKRKIGKKMRQAMNYLKANRDEWGDTYRDLGERAGVSHTLIMQAFDMIEEEERGNPPPKGASDDT